MITTEEIKRRLWDGATELRGSMDASRYKDYMLGLMFYKFLSDKTLDSYRILSQSKALTNDELVLEYKKAREEHGGQLDIALQKQIGYFILPHYLYQVWLSDINNGDFEVQKVTDSLQYFERTISVSDSGADFKGLFSNNSIDLSDTALGSNLKERSENIQSLIKLFSDLDMVSLQKSDALGDAYEYLIGQFAMQSGKKAGEFYTPRQVSEVMAQIIAKNSNISSLYDPTVGSGSLLLTVSRHLSSDVQRNLTYYGQELNTATYNLTRMNLLLHGVRPDKMQIRNANTLGDDWPEDSSRPNEGVLFDAVVMNPPYSVKKWNKYDLKLSDPRFEIAGVLPPDGKGDYAFLLHGLFHLGQQGTMAIVLPHGVLFRGGSEGEIRKRLLEKNYIDAIIGLPNNLFTNTSIAVTIIILKKNRSLHESVLIIDSSNHYTKVGKQNVLLEKDIAKIVDAFSERSIIKGYSNLITREEIIKNEFNLNIPRYIERIDDEIPNDVDGHIFGGIPKHNIDNLTLLNLLVPDVLNQSFSSLRPDYKLLNVEIAQLKKTVLEHTTVVEKRINLMDDFNKYVDKYLVILKTIKQTSDIVIVKESMLKEIKELLSKYRFINIYEGYQIIAKLWNNHLNKDTELIANSDFYEIAKTRTPNMVTKGTGNQKRELQEGWVGTIIPNDLILKHIFYMESAELKKLNEKINDIEAKLEELVEAAKIEETDEYYALNDCIKRETDDELGNLFVKSELVRELKEARKDSIEFEYLSKAINYLLEITELKKIEKGKFSKLIDRAHEKVLELNNNEIDLLINIKWFELLKPQILNLIDKPIQIEIDIIEKLSIRYGQTLYDIDDELSKLEKSFESIVKELVVSK